MIEHRITFTEEELVASATQDNLSILALTKFLRSLPSDQRGFFRAFPLSLWQRRPKSRKVRAESP